MSTLARGGVLSLRAEPGDRVIALVLDVANDRLSLKIVV
jgi:hypothetical protein